MAHYPDFDDLPKVDDLPQGCAWGVFDKHGSKDVHGTLNFITPDVVKAAYASELKDGVSVSLNWPIDAIKTPGFGRKGLVHKVVSFVDSPLKAHGYDDEVEFNTQCSSQFDSLVHFHHQPSGKGYNGIQTSVDELKTISGPDKPKHLPTLDRWHDIGGLVGRGVFIDYKRYADENGIKYSPFDSHQITVEDIEKIAKQQKVEFRPGDVILIRSGFTEELTHQSEEVQSEKMGTHRACGVSGTKETAKWFWNKRFAAVAGDMIAFEQMPPVLEGGKEGTVGELVLHQYFLGLFGMHIGELWDLKALSDTCHKLGRYSFLLTSCPLNVPNAVGSPPNALALF